MQRRGLFGLAATAALAGCAATSSQQPQVVRVSEPSSGRFEVLASKLANPWDFARLPDGRVFITLSDSGQVMLLAAGNLSEVGRLKVNPAGEGGLLGIALAPDFERSGQVFVYHSTSTDNRVVALHWDGVALSASHTVIDSIPHSGIHNGGRLAFGPDKKLYVTTGDASKRATGQDPASLGGKILRINPDGSTPADNPDPKSPVWTLGHRNVQGIAWDVHGRAYASEFGQDTWDEFNLIEKGRNYGWPQDEGMVSGSEHAQPLAVWRPAEASPSGIAINGDFAYVACLRGTRVWKLHLKDARVRSMQPLLVGKFGRIRSVQVISGKLWLLTSNSNRGKGAGDDDRLIVHSLSGA